MFAKGQSIIQIFEQLAPKQLAIPEDKIGLQVGTLHKEVKKVMLTLDVLENVVDEAIENQVNLIITHHAIIYLPLKNVRTDLSQGRIIEKLIKHDIAVYVAHTNLDAAEGGVNDVLAHKLALKETELLDATFTEKYNKIVVFVPKTHQQQVFDALSNHGAGWIGNYSHCSFQTPGTGTFMPLEGTNPFIGEQDKLEKINEIRIETIVSEKNLNRTIQAMIKVHPYEEVAYDVYPLNNKGKQYGIGRLGKLGKPATLKDFSLFVKQQLNLEGLRVVGDLKKEIKKVAIVGGDGNSFVNTAAFRGVDVLVTGDIYYHVAHEAMAQGLAIIDAGHNIEKNVMDKVKDYLEKEFVERKYKTEIIISTANTNPFIFL